MTGPTVDPVTQRGCSCPCGASARRTTAVLEEFPKSSITLWFDFESRVNKVSVHRVAGSLYADQSSMIGDNWIPSDRPLLFGLSA
jgi:hypothetical protein